MDKNTITGLVLIAAIFIGFGILTKPSQEEIEKERRYQDSIALLQKKEITQDLQNSNVNQTAGNTNNNLSGFFQATTQDTSIRTTADSTVTDKTKEEVSAVNTETKPEEIVSLENDLLKIDISSKGGQIIKAQLKKYSTYEDLPLYMTDNDGSFSLELMNKQGVKLETKDLVFKPTKNNNSQTLVMRMNYSDNQYIDFIYALDPDSYTLKFSISTVGMQNILDKQSSEEFTIKWNQKLRRQEKSEKNEQHYANIYYKYINSSVENMSESSNDTKDVTLPLKWVSFKDQFFASIIVAEKEFSASTMKSTMLNSPQYLKQYETILSIPTDVKNGNTVTANMQYVFTPLDYYMLKNYDVDIKNNAQKLDFDKLIPLGWSIFRYVNQYFVIPLFNLLESTGMQMGLVILLLTLIVKLIISPLTYKSFISSAKMKVLRPQVEEINEKYPGQEKAMERQKATMALYSQAGVNPMSGCIPMLLQMPILLALFAFFPSAIELRHKSFLWAHDLSTYDAIVEWKTNIPFISSWLGNHISLFCVLMTITNIIYTKVNMDATNTGQQQMPGMKWMMMLMPLIFFFVLNNYPSGLTYYYFLSTLMTIIITMSFRYFVNEDKLLAKLEENKKKPKKKGWMASMQEKAEQAQRAQQQQLKNKQKGNKKK